jgi:hypothetical protein
LNTSILVHESVDSLILDNLSRIHDLHIVNPPPKWAYHLPSISPLADCSFDPDHPECRDGSALPLRRLSSRAPLQHPVASVGDYLACRVKIMFEQAVKIMLRCPNLVEFRFCLPYPNS